MKLLEVVESTEKCTEAGWFAYDFHMDEPLASDTILLFRSFGNFLYLTMLKEPFYKIESDYYIIKGIEGKDFFRVAAHQDYCSIVDQVKSLF
ncbi:MAG: hypothetical protein RRX92_02205 [Lachnospiraceae bacterium]